MKRLGLNATLNIAVICSLFIGIFFIIFYTTKSTHDISLNIKEEALQATANNISKAFELFVANAIDQTETLSSQPIVVDALEGSPQQATKMLQQFVNQSENISSAIIIDVAGKPVAGGTKKGEPLPPSYADREYVKAILTGQQSYVTQTVLKGKATGELIVVAAHAVNGPDGKLLGIVIVSPLWEPFTKKFIDSVTFGETGYGYMLDAQGIIIAQSSPIVGMSMTRTRASGLSTGGAPWRKPRRRALHAPRTAARG